MYVALTAFTCYFLASRGRGVGVWDFKARTGSMRRCFVVAPSAHKAELIGLHLIQASRDTVTVRGWHSGSEHFVELQEVPTMAASHRGSFGKAHRELVVLVLKVELRS